MSAPEFILKFEILFQIFAESSLLNVGDAFPDCFLSGVSPPRSIPTRVRGSCRAEWLPLGECTLVVSGSPSSSSLGCDILGIFRFDDGNCAATKAHSIEPRLPAAAEVDNVKFMANQEAQNAPPVWRVSVSLESVGVLGIPTCNHVYDVVAPGISLCLELLLLAAHGCK
eukprot:Opistho-2@15594